MKRLLLPLLAAIALPNNVNAVDINCESPVWKKKDVCIKKKAKRKEPKFCKNENLSAIQKEECLSYENYLKVKNAKKPPKYPVEFHGFAPLIDSNTGKRVIKNWSSENKENLVIKIVNGRKKFTVLHTIPKERIISFKQSLIDMSDNSGEIATNVGISAVLLPIGALFQGFNYKKTEHYKWEISFIDKFGRKITKYLYPTSTVPVADRYYTFLPDFTGLKNGESRPEESLREFYLDGITKFEEKLEKDFLDLSISNDSNNCRVLNSEKYPLSSSIFLEEKKQFDSLREKFDLEPYVFEGYCK